MSQQRQRHAVDLPALLTGHCSAASRYCATTNARCPIITPPANTLTQYVHTVVAAPVWLLAGVPAVPAVLLWRRRRDDVIQWFEVGTAGGVTR